MIEQGQILGSPTLMTSVLSQIYQAAYEKGYAEKDTVSFYEILRGMAGLEEREGIPAFPIAAFGSDPLMRILWKHRPRATSWV